MAQASARSAALKEPFRGVAVPCLLAFSSVLLFFVVSSAFAAENAKPDVVTPVHSPRPSIVNAVPPKKDAKPVVCDPKAAGQARPGAESNQVSSRSSNAEGNNKNASGQAGSDLSVGLSKVESPGRSDARSTSSEAGEDNGGENTSTGESSGLEVRLKDKEIESSPPPSPPQCSVPGASQAEQSPAPH